MKQKKFKDQYRSASTRLSGYDYGTPGWYHVVICTKNHTCLLGSIRNGLVGLSRAGCIVVEEWQKTPGIRPYMQLDAWIVMPNHVHGILGITSVTPALRDGCSQPTDVETPRRGVSTTTKKAEPEKPLQPHSLGAIVGQIKSICTKRIRRLVYPDFAWQPRFYDRVIRNQRELSDTRRYILENPLKWEEDENHPANW